MQSSKKYYETSIDTTKVAMERIMRAFLLTGSHFTSSFRIGNYPLGRGISAFLIVCIPEGKEDEFCKLSGCKLKEPTAYHVHTN